MTRRHLFIRRVEYQHISLARDFAKSVLAIMRIGEDQEVVVLFALLSNGRVTTCGDFLVVDGG